MKKYFALFILLLLASVAVIAQTDPPVDPEPAFNWWTIVSGVLAVLATIFGTALAKAKSVASRLINLGRQAIELLETVSDAIGDNSVTKEEIASIKQEVADVKAAWKALWNKT